MNNDSSCFGRFWEMLKSGEYTSLSFPCTYVQHNSKCRCGRTKSFVIVIWHRSFSTCRRRWKMRPLMHGETERTSVRRNKKSSRIPIAGYPITTLLKKRLSFILLSCNNLSSQNASDTNNERNCATKMDQTSTDH
jgi:hypothetical protein